jgi:hypothetical protein
MKMKFLAPLIAVVVTIVGYWWVRHGARVEPLPAGGAQVGERTKNAVVSPVAESRVKPTVKVAPVATAVEKSDSKTEVQVPPQTQVPPVPATPKRLEALFLVAPFSSLDPASEAGKVAAEARVFFGQGQTNAAVDALSAAVKDPACQNGRPELVRMLVSLFLVSDRIGDAQDLCANYVTDDTFGCSAAIISYLLREKNDPAAVIAWTERMESLQLSDGARSQNLGANLIAVIQAGRFDDVIARVPEIVSRPNDTGNINSLRPVINDLLSRSDFDNAELLLKAIEAAAGEKPDYAEFVVFVRQMMKNNQAMKNK